jgi:hypothetical protein
MKKLAGSLYPLLLGAMFCSFFLVPATVAIAQVPQEQMMTIDQFKDYLASQGRTLSEARQEELMKLKEGGPLSERVLKIGISTFILNLAAIYIVACIAAFVILVFFTPFGLFIFRGNLHSFIGSLLKATGISKKFGDHLIKEPKKYLQKYHSVREAFAMYMHNEFIPDYKNNITAIAFIGTAFLIMNIGLRGVKFMTSHQPNLIIIAILVEITVLCLLGLTTWYEKEEPEEEGDGAGMQGKQLTLAEVESRLDALKAELEASVTTDRHLRGV